MAEAMDTGPEGVAYATETATSAEELWPKVTEDIDVKDKKAVKAKETAISNLCEQLYKAADADGLRRLIDAIKPFLNVVSKAKGGKLFKQIIDRFVDLTNATADEKVAMCKDCISWAKDSKRTFLRQALEVRLISLHLEAGEYQECLTQIRPLLRELKRLDDRQLLMEVHLMESKAYFFLSNYPKARAALVAARTIANSIYCPPRMQASLDLQSGVLHAQEADFKTAYSYLYEAFEGFDSVDVPQAALRSLKYMLLAKILLEEAADIPAIITGKLALKYSGRELDAMQAVASASLNRSLADFQQAMTDFAKELKEDFVVQNHVTELYDSLLEQNLMRLVEPFSRVEIDHLAELIDLPVDAVEQKLSQMILDHKLHGILDQGANCLQLFDEEARNETYQKTLDTIAQTNLVVDALYKKAKGVV
ncbi:26S proteasome non-ATPase regulatory subunit 11 [Salpingoeca rosetta]|uniref:26S proteasome non-ATPase regulatory subunit 11 n=1 Tax=Salpingoeca rosetta (strain ATCC 50818 / BSB-021) TaxID=946362 RepID=F2UQN2_SALR5|nr:26S proteasome non-ATPase regulatory subunit 11 [Salpingoeca rosetta]EGD79937.1 26S proteasome non-ATPase regulatory subunit 11 [Salpingoeca rosetta]|eukprot:XP_004988558.1 26S proteasome non-ATPase regulatory subunit 11 [Salpingoeca rosetta]